MSELNQEIARRRTFAIISHPDAGKTTLTEKLLLFGGAATQEFVLALLIGIVSGTYSSIFVASMLLVVWHQWDDQRHGRVPAGPRTARSASA